jgi:hypothetical protein
VRETLVVSVAGTKIYVTEFSTRAVGSIVMNDVVSEPASVTGTISDITVGWIIGLGCLVCDDESSIVVSGVGPSRESRVTSVTGDGYAGIVVGSPGMSRLSTDTSICGDRMVMVHSPSGSSEEVVLVVSFCRTLSSVYCVSTSSDVKEVKPWATYH